MILVIGDINLDIIVNLREDINFDTDSDSEIDFSGGGSAANFSFWLDYLNTPVRFISKTGDDFISNFLKNEYAVKYNPPLNITTNSIITPNNFINDKYAIFFLQF